MVWASATDHEGATGRRDRGLRRSGRMSAGRLLARGNAARRVTAAFDREHVGSAGRFPASRGR